LYCWLGSPLYLVFKNWRLVLLTWYPLVSCTDEVASCTFDLVPSWYHRCLAVMSRYLLYFTHERSPNEQCVLLKITLLWNLKSYSLVDSYNDFGGACCLCLQYGRASCSRSWPLGLSPYVRRLSWLLCFVSSFSPSIQTPRQHPKFAHDRFPSLYF